MGSVYKAMRIYEKDEDKYVHKLLECCWLVCVVSETSGDTKLVNALIMLLILNINGQIGNPILGTNLELHREIQYGGRSVISSSNIVINTYNINQFSFIGQKEFPLQNFRRSRRLLA